MEKKKFPTVQEILVNVIDTICDQYCKWPDHYKALHPDDLDAAYCELMKEKCENCPFDNIGV